MNGLQTTTHLQRYQLLSADSGLGPIKAFYFDDDQWAIRYLAVQSSNRHADQCFLVATVSIGQIVEQGKTIYIELTGQQIENSPPIDTEKPLTAGVEQSLHNYYGWIPYWQSAELSTLPPAGRSKVSLFPPDHPAAAPSPSPLHKTSEIAEFKIAATDGVIGRVNDFIIDTRYWVIRYLEVYANLQGTRKNILISPNWLEYVDLNQRLMSVSLTRELIMTAPEFNPSKTINRHYELKLFRHYERPVYWGVAQMMGQTPSVIKSLL